MKVKANSQKYQALYIDTDAKENKDKIVLIEETCESLPQAQGILNSMLKEPYYGVVVEGSGISIMKFRSKLIDADTETGLGSKGVSDILTEVVNLAYSNKCEIPYFKGPVQYGDLPQMSVAFDFKSLFDISKFKEAGKDFMDNLIGVNKELRDEVSKIDLKEYKKTQEWIRKNEKEFKEVEKLLKDGDKKTVDLDNFLKNAVLDTGIEEYLGKDYDNLKFYEVDLKSFKQNVPSLKDEADISVEQIDRDKEEDDTFNPDFDFKPKSQDPREILKALLTSLPTTYGKKMDPANIVDIGMSNEQKLLVAVKKPVDFDLPYWPKSPLNNPTLKLIEKFHFLKQKKIIKK